MVYCNIRTACWDNYEFLNELDVGTERLQRKKRAHDSSGSSEHVPVTDVGTDDYAAEQVKRRKIQTLK